MDVFGCAALATIIQVAIWLLLVVIKTINRVRQIVLGKEKSRETLNK